MFNSFYACLVIKRVHIMIKMRINTLLNVNSSALSYLKTYDY